MRRTPLRCRVASAGFGCALALAGMVIAVACSEPLEFADWTIEVPEGTRIIEYPAVPIEERSERIELVEDLVVGSTGDFSFYRPFDVAVDDDSNIYVLDSGADNIQVFAADGRHLSTLGGPGQGPGELRSPISIAASGDRIITSDSQNLRLSVWSGDGVLIEDRKPAQLMEFLTLLAAPVDGPMIGVYIDGSSGEVTYILLALSPDGQEMARFAEFPNPPDTGLPPLPALLPLMSRFPFAHHLYAADREAHRIFVSPGSAYQVLAYSNSGEPGWALRVSGSPDPFPDNQVAEITRAVHEQAPDFPTSDLNFPTDYPALSNLRTDGRGNLYVYPYVADVTRDSIVPVDVYAPDGERLFAGLIRNVAWSAALGDHVYAIVPDPDTEESTMVRYRLAAPFLNGQR